RHQTCSRRRAPNPAVLFGKRAKQQRADELSDVARANQYSALRRRDVPETDQHRQRERERQSAKRIKESRAANDHAGFGVPSRKGNILDSSDQAGGVRLNVLYHVTANPPDWASPRSDSGFIEYTRTGL